MITSIKIDDIVYGINATAVNGHQVELTGVSSNTDTLPTTAQTKKYVDDKIYDLTSGSIADLRDETNDLYSITDDLQTQISDNKDEFQSMIEDEATARSTGDTNTLTSAKAYTDEAVSAKLLTMWPIGSVYIAANNNVSPAVLVGGTWEQINDRVLVSAGTRFLCGTTGGSWYHTITIKEMPSHQHMVRLRRIDGVQGTEGPNGVIDGNGCWNYWTVDNAGNSEFTGGGESMEIVPPYLAVYMWKRIA